MQEGASASIFKVMKRGDDRRTEFGTALRDHRLQPVQVRSSCQGVACDALRGDVGFVFAHVAARHRPVDSLPLTLRPQLLSKLKAVSVRIEHVQKAHLAV